VGQADQAVETVTEPGATEPDKQEPHRTHESPIQRILVESALIVFSILLALAVNSYVDARKERALTERSLRGVRDELTANLEAVQDVRAYHDTLAQETQAVDAAHEATSYTEFRAHTAVWHGFHNPELNATAWQSAITLGSVANMGYDTVRVLSSVYATQAKFDQYTQNGLNTFDFSDAAMPSTIRRMYVYVETMGTLEDTLAARYTRALKLLHDAPASPRVADSTPRR
jgi:type II secretory pathway pseudopilin PulG